MDSKTVVFEEVSQHFSEALQKDILIIRIEKEAIKQWSENWKTVPNPRKKPDGGWDWALLWKDYCYKRFRYRKQYMVDIAIYVKQELCGLALGGIEKDNSYISIDYVEGSPIIEHPLKGHVLDIILTGTCRYATIYNISELRLDNPVDGLISYYESKGFETVHGDKNYCFIRLNNEHFTV